MIDSLDNNIELLRKLANVDYFLHLRWVNHCVEILPSFRGLSIFIRILFILT